VKPEWTVILTGVPRCEAGGLPPGPPDRTTGVRVTAAGWMIRLEVVVGAFGQEPNGGRRRPLLARRRGDRVSERDLG
jgi:hypothetical protein